VCLRGQGCSQTNHKDSSVVFSDEGARKIEGQTSQHGSSGGFERRGRQNSTQINHNGSSGCFPKRDRQRRMSNKPTWLVWGLRGVRRAKRQPDEQLLAHLADFGGGWGTSRARRDALAHLELREVNRAKRDSSVVFSDEGAQDQRPNKPTGLVWGLRGVRQWVKCQPYEP
jgi:hypothetical protein